MGGGYARDDRSIAARRRIFSLPQLFHVNPHFFQISRRFLHTDARIPLNR